MLKDISSTGIKRRTETVSNMFLQVFLALSWLKSCILLLGYLPETWAHVTDRAERGRGCQLGLPAVSLAEAPLHQGHEASCDHGSQEQPRPQS